MEVNYRDWNGFHSNQLYMIEIFAGVGILCSVAKQFGLENSLAVDKHRKNNARVSIMQLDLFKEADQSLLLSWLESPNLLWVHLAPVCGTASGARNIRRFEGDPPPLRSSEFPEGLPWLTEAEAERVRLANILYEFSMKIYVICCLKGILVTVENPKNSFFWLTVWVLNVLASHAVYNSEFQHCMMGGSRDKWTRIIANFPSISQMSIKCDRTHTHAAWGFAHDEQGRQVWATSLESQYPRKLCITLVSVVMQFAAAKGLQLPALDLQADLDNPLHRPHHSRVRTGMQPRTAKLPPVVSQYRSIAVYFAEQVCDVPCSLMSKLANDVVLYSDSGTPVTVPKAA